MEKPEHKPALVNIDASPPVKTSTKRVSDDRDTAPAKKKFQAYLEPEPETIDANDNGWAIPKHVPKSSRKSSRKSVIELLGSRSLLSPSGANLLRRPPTGSKRTSFTSISETSFSAASPAKSEHADVEQAGNAADADM